MNSLDHVYRRLREAWGEEAPRRFRDAVVLDEEARTLYSSPFVLDRLVAAQPEAGSVAPAWSSLYTWALEAVLEGETGAGTAPLAARALIARGCVQRPDGVGALLLAHERAVDRGAHATVEHLSGLLPVVVALLAEARRHEETGRVLEHLERLGDLTALGLCLVRAESPDQEMVVRYVNTEAGSLRAVLGAIHRDRSLRRRLLTLAFVRLVAFPEREEPEESRALQEAFRREPRRFTALFWGDEARGTLVEGALGLGFSGIRFWQEACRERWFFDWIVWTTGQPEAEVLPSELLATSAQRSGRVAAWLAEEPATAPGYPAGTGWRFRLLLLRARIPRSSLYGQVLARTLQDGPELADAEVTALRRLVDSTAPVEPRLWLLPGALVGLGLCSGVLLGHGLWPWFLLCVFLTMIPAGLLAGRLFIMEVFMSLWARPVLLPPRDTERAKGGLRGTVRGWAILSESRTHRWLFRRSSFLERRLVPLWELAAHREEVQADYRLSTRLSGVLGGRPIHAADDVSALLARNLPREAG